MKELTNVIVTGACGLPEVSTGAYLDVVAEPVITQGPDPRTVCNGSNVSFSVVATGENLTYLWQKDGADIAPAETNPNLDVFGVTAAQEGIYRCVVSNAACGSVNSTSA
ncbi:MAG: immunoglobulin domain-containing protein [Bacteroidales bacterium]|nr:immunoglobulin domain-containing protein [Bacteroidales bacterium]